jgi:hypothetical protein
LSVSSGRTKAFETGWRPRSTTSRRTPPHKRQLYSVKSFPYLACQQVGEKLRRLLRASNAFWEVLKPGNIEGGRSRHAIRNPADPTSRYHPSDSGRIETGSGDWKRLTPRGRPVNLALQLIHMVKIL